MNPRDIDYKHKPSLEDDLAALILYNIVVEKAAAELRRAKQAQQTRWEQMQERAFNGQFPERAIVKYDGTLYEIKFDVDDLEVPEISNVDNWTGYYEVA